MTYHTEKRCLRIIIDNINNLYVNYCNCNFSRKELKSVFQKYFPVKLNVYRTN